MNIKPIRNLVHPKSVFELPKNKRSFSERNHIAQELSNTMKKNLMNLPDKELSLDKYKEILYKIIYPAKPDIRFFPLPKFKNYGGMLSSRVTDVIDGNNCYAVHMGYDMYLPINNKEIIKDKNVAIHESRHLFDCLCNPKYNAARLSHLLINEDKKEITKETLNYLVYTQFFNIPFFENLEINNFQKRALKKLEQFSNTDKIRILQTARYQILSELNAYTDIEEYSVPQVGYEVSKIETLQLRNKLSFVEKELKKALKEERSKFAKQA